MSTSTAAKGTSTAARYSSSVGYGMPIRKESTSVFSGRWHRMSTAAFAMMMSLSLSRD